jgi:hypothetical protein
LQIVATGTVSKVIPNNSPGVLAGTSLDSFEAGPGQGRSPQADLPAHSITTNEKVFLEPSPCSEDSPAPCAQQSTRPDVMDVEPSRADTVRVVDSVGVEPGIGMGVGKTDRAGASLH